MVYKKKVLVPLSPQVRTQNLGKTLKIKAFSGFFVSSAWQKNEGFGTLQSYNGLDSIIDLLETRTEISYQYMLADAYIDNGQHNLVNTLVSGIPQLVNYSSQDALDYADFQSWYNLRVSMAEEGLSWTDMNETQKATVIALASSGNENPPMLWANSVLDLLGISSYYEEEVRIPDMPSFKTENSNIESVNPETLIRVYPNPASDLVQVAEYGNQILDSSLISE